jgi:hypothetical protein
MAILGRARLLFESSKPRTAILERNRLSMTSRSATARWACDSRCSVIEQKKNIEYAWRLQPQRRRGLVFGRIAQRTVSAASRPAGHPSECGALDCPVDKLNGAWDDLDLSDYVKRQTI